MVAGAVGAELASLSLPLPSFSFSFSRSSFVGLTLRRLNHKLGLRSNSFEERSSSLSFSPPLSFSFSFSFVSLPFTYLRGTSGTGGTSSVAFRGETSPSAVDGRILELLGELRSVWNSPPWERIGVVGDVVVTSETPGIRIEGSDFFRDGSVKEPPSGGVTREGEDGVVGIGGCGIGGCRVGAAGGE
jgi:hypothetical protein